MCPIVTIENQRDLHVVLLSHDLDLALRAPSCQLPLSTKPRVACGAPHRPTYLNNHGVGFGALRQVFLGQVILRVDLDDLFKDRNTETAAAGDKGVGGSWQNESAL